MFVRQKGNGLLTIKLNKDCSVNAMLKMVKYVEKLQASTIQKFWGTIDTKFD